MKIKILYFVYPYIWGGTEQFIFTLLKHLDRKKFVPVVASFVSGRFVKKFQSLGIHTIIVRPGEKDPIPWERLIKKEGARIAQTNIFNFSLALAARRAGIPHIWRVGTHVNVAGEKITGLGRRNYLDLISCLADLVICPSGFLKAQFVKSKGTEVTVIPNGLDPAEIDGKANGLGGGRPSIAMIGHLQPQKRHLDFIKAAKKVYEEYPESRFLILGGRCYAYRGNHLYAKEIFRKVRELKMQKRISIAPSYKDIFEKVSKADMVVLPSIHEGASLSVLEAMALGKPVVAARSGGNPEMVEHGRTGLLVPPKSPKKLAEAILFLLRNRKRARRMGEAGRRRVERLFDIRKIVRSYEKIYRELLQRCG